MTLRKPKSQKELDQEKQELKIERIKNLLWARKRTKEKLIFIDEEIKRLDDDYLRGYTGDNP